MYLDNFTLSDYGFDFAFELSKFGEAVYDETYYYYEVENVNSWWAPDENGIINRYKTSTDLEMAPCTFYNATQKEVENLGINQSYYCPKIVHKLQTKKLYLGLCPFQDSVEKRRKKIMQKL